MAERIITREERYTTDGLPSNRRVDEPVVVNNDGVVDNGVLTSTEVRAARSARVVYYILGIIEVLLALRFVFRLLGANPGSPFVQFIYSLSGIFQAPFSGIFPGASTRGAVAAAVFEPSTLVAMIVYAIIAWGIVKLFVLSAARPKQVERQL